MVMRRWPSHGGSDAPWVLCPCSQVDAITGLSPELDIPGPWAMVLLGTAIVGVEIQYESVIWKELEGFSSWEGHRHTFPCSPH